MKLRFFIAAVCFFSSFSLLAVEIDNLYSAKLRIDSQVRKDRNLAQKGALRQVLVKVSGDQQVLNNKLIKSKLTRATEYMTQYRFVNEGGEQLLEATFDRKKVNQLLSQAGFPIWGSRRPLVMVWVVLQDQQLQRTLFADSVLLEEKKLLSIIAQERGLAINYPLMDLQDVMQVSENDVWGRFYDPLQVTSRRYGADLNLVVRIAPEQQLFDEDVQTDELLGDFIDDASEYYQQQLMEKQRRDAERERLALEQLTDAQNGADQQHQTTSQQDAAEPNAQQPDSTDPVQWVIQWSLLDSQVFSQQQGKGESVVKLVEDMVHQVANILAAKYAINTQSEGSESLTIQITNVTSIDNFVSVHRFLQSLTAVSSAALTSVNGERAYFKLQLAGGESDFIKAVALDNRLQRIYDPLNQSQQTSELEFSWHP